MTQESHRQLTDRERIDGIGAHGNSLLSPEKPETFYKNKVQRSMIDELGNSRPLFEETEEIADEDAASKPFSLTPPPNEPILDADMISLDGEFDEKALEVENQKLRGDFQLTVLRN